MPTTYVWTGASSTAFGTAGNWTPAGPPTTGDTGIFDYNATRALAGSDQSAITLAALHIRSTVPSTDYVGDQATPLKIGATAWRINDPSLGPTVGNCAQRINLDFGTAVFTGVVVGSAVTSADTGQESIRIKGVNTSNLLVVQSGLVGVATNAATDVATLGEIDVLGSGATVNVASGVTINSTIKQTAGTLNANCAVPTLRQIGGTLTTTGSGAISTAAYVAGSATFNSTGTITLLEVLGGGTADFLQDFQPKTVTTCKLYKGATLKFGSHVTFTNPIQFVECSPSDVTIVVRPNISLVVAYL